MILTSTSTIENKKIKKYLGIVSGEAIIGTNIFKDVFSSIRGVVGGRSSSYERVLKETKRQALADLEEQAKAKGANAVVGIDLDYETIGPNGGMLMLSANGTAVVLE